VFKINQSTGVLTTVVEFDNVTNKGRSPTGGVVLDGAGYLWGVTEQGGVGSNKNQKKGDGGLRQH
jgi:hypothetical protein